MKYNYVTEEITITKKELYTAFSDIKEFNILLDNITYLWLTEAYGFTKKEAKRFIEMGNRKEKYNANPNRDSEPLENICTKGSE